MKDKTLETLNLLKKAIDKKRERLNELMGLDNVDSDTILKLSEELDKLIYEYYSIHKKFVQ
ncbi:aspartyl-phosphate phosphatase Spo0E family protein [Caldisalinibacter kiritimatiensis]|uniref:Spo0E like sporulation regulatory protein n=1 Tax=Caldisalinibacter kiritimatiensis TaxID=1304284 RepID=R1CSR6_9FIRM|nr:aspartyl-phosphate phosphatase Spo0E family protein [Caldisalinibacter kiritimatiensis]EOC99748.1 hypothetical protein L21TH_2226 [Caldisalinibacter kiritimatiensis]